MDGAKEDLMDMFSVHSVAEIKVRLFSCVVVCEYGHWISCEGAARST